MIFEETEIKSSFKTLVLNITVRIPSLDRFAP